MTRFGQRSSPGRVRRPPELPLTGIFLRRVSVDLGRLGQSREAAIGERNGSRRTTSKCFGTHSSAPDGRIRRSSFPDDVSAATSTPADASTTFVTPRRARECSGAFQPRSRKRRWPHLHPPHGANGRAPSCTRLQSSSKTRPRSPRRWAAGPRLDGPSRPRYFAPATRTWTCGAIAWPVVGSSTLGPWKRASRLGWTGVSAGMRLRQSSCCQPRLLSSRRRC